MTFPFWYMTPRERMTLIVLMASALAATSILAWRKTHERVEAFAEATVQQRAWEQQLAAARTVNLNTASVEELRRLPRIGEATAERIVAYRAQHGPFLSVQELDRVSGIGPKTLIELQPYLIVEQ